MKTWKQLIEAGEVWFNRVGDEGETADHLDRLLNDGAKLTDLYPVLADFAFEQLEAYKAEVMDAVEAVERTKSVQFGFRYAADALNAVKEAITKQ